MIQMLIDKRVVSFDLHYNFKTIDIDEECDNCFGVTLDKEGFGRLIDELIDIHKSMK